MECLGVEVKSRLRVGKPLDHISLRTTTALARHSKPKHTPQPFLQLQSVSDLLAPRIILIECPVANGYVHHSRSGNQVRDSRERLTSTADTKAAKTLKIKSSLLAMHSPS